MPLRDSDDDDDYSLGAVPQSPGSSLGHYRSNSLTSSLSTPCGFLVNGQDCIYGLRCVNSHSPDVIAAWTSRRGRMSCKHGPTCELAQRGICLYYHPKSHRTRQSQRDRMMMEGLTGQEIIDIRCPPSGNGTIGISDEEELASFNKLGDDEILVPGSPPRFCPPTRQINMAPDMQNRKTLELRYPRFSYVFAPLIAAVEQRDSAEPGRSDAASSVLRSADIVTNASNLRKLLHLLTGRKYLCERYDIELVAGPDGAANDTLFLSKWTDDPSLHTSMGHGAGFERATCRYPQGHGGDEARLLRRSVSHHRVVAYSLGGLRMVVQSEVDAYHCDCASHCSPSKATTPLPTPPSSPKMAKAAAVVASASSSTARRHPSKTTATTHTTGQTHPKHRPAAAPDSFEVAGSSKRRGPRSGNNGTSVSNHGSIGSSTRVVSPPPPKTGSGRQRNSFGALTVDDPGDTAAFKARAQEDDSPLLTPPPSPTQPRCPTFTPLPKTENAVSTADFGGLRVHHVPSTAIIPAKCLLEVKTRDARYNPLFPPEAQLYFSRMARLFEATHLRGVFDVPLSSRTSLPTVAAAIPFSGIRPLPGFEHLPHQLAARPSQPQRRSTAPPATTSSWSPKQSWTRSDPGWQRTTSDLNLTNTSPSSYATGEIQDMTTHLRCWEFENQEPLARLVALLGKVVEAARARLRGARRDAAAESNTPRSVKLALICEHVRDAQEGGSAPPHSGGHVVVSLWDRPSGKALVPPHSLSTAAANDSKCRGRQKHQQQWQQQQQTVIR